MTSKVVLLIVALNTLFGVNALAVEGRNRGSSRTHPLESEKGFSELFEKEYYPKDNLVNRYIQDELHVKDVSLFNFTLGFRKEVTGLTKSPLGESNGGLSEEARAQALAKFSEQSEKTIVNVIRTFGRTEYSNPVVLGEAGVGKTFLLNQLASVLSYGIMPDSLADALGLAKATDPTAAVAPFKAFLEAFVGNTDLVLINTDLLSQDNTKEGKAFSSEEVRMRSVLTEIFEAAKKEFARSGRRTLFIFDEVATLPEIVQPTLKKLLDSTGFHDPRDPVQKASDSGFMILPMTTPDEYRKMVDADSAVERRTKQQRISEPTEEAALQILMNKAETWQKIYGLSIEPAALEYVIYMRKLFNNPPLAMPASVLAATNDLFLDCMGQKGRTADKPITLEDAQSFVMRNAGLPDTWLPGPNGEPPFHDLAERVKKRVIGQDEVVDVISERLKTWIRLGGEVPVFFLGGSSGSGKDTLVKAFNVELFGDERSDLMHSIGGIEGYGINALIEGPPLGNHSDDKGAGLLAEALFRKPHGIITLNEGKDAPTGELEKLKVFIESGVIKGRGRDTRERPLQFNPIFILGQWGEDYFDGKSEAEIDQIYAGLTQSDVEKPMLVGQKEGTVGRISYALLQRAKATGGIFLLKPVKRTLFPKIVDILTGGILKRLKARNRLDAKVEQSLVDFISKTSADAAEGPRGLKATTVDFTETAISKAIDKGLPIRSVSVRVRYELDATTSKDMVLVDQLRGDVVEKTFSFEASTLRRAKSRCEGLLKGEPVKTSE